MARGKSTGRSFHPALSWTQLAVVSTNACDSSPWSRLKACKNLRDQQHPALPAMHGSCHLYLEQALQQAFLTWSMQTPAC